MNREPFLLHSSTRIEGSELPDRETELVAWVKQERETGQLHPLLIVAICIVVFLEIQPFQDGNGRLSRVLTTLLLLQAGYAYVPYSSLESVIEQSKEASIWRCTERRGRSARRRRIGSPG